jgi:hypothetical protein
MSRKLKPTTLAILAALKAKPEAKPRELAAEYGVAVSYIYKLRKQMRDKSRRKVTIAPGQVAIARAMGVPLDEYVKEGLKQGVFKYDGERPIVNPEITIETDETNVDQVLDSRAKDYGKFIEGAEIMQMLKRVVHNYIEDRGTPLAFDQREAIDMIIHKLGRIINGNPDKVDHWVDVAGYSTLVADRLRGNAR